MKPDVVLAGLLTGNSAAAQRGGGRTDDAVLAGLLGQKQQTSVPGAPHSPHQYLHRAPLKQQLIVVCTDCWKMTVYRFHIDSLNFRRPWQGILHLLSFQGLGITFKVS